MSIIVREIWNTPGDFEVLRGGDVHVGRGHQAQPSTAKRGDTVSAATICEWVENGILVEARASVATAGFHVYADHHQGCAAIDERHPAHPRACDCGFDKIRRAATYN